MMIISWSLCRIGSLLGLVGLILAGSACAKTKTPSCETPELRALSQLLLEGSGQEAYQALLPFREFPPDEVPEATQRCLIETYLASPSMYKSLKVDHDSLEFAVGVVDFHRYRQEPYLKPLVSRRPSPILLEVYGEAVVPHLLETKIPLYGHFFGRAWIGTAEAAYLMAEDGLLSLSAEQVSALEARFQDWLDRPSKIDQFPVYNLQSLRLRKRFEPGFDEDAEKQNVLEHIDLSLPESQLASIEEFLALGIPEGFALLEYLIQKEQDDDLRAYFQDLRNWGRGEGPKPRHTLLIMEKLGRLRSWEIPVAEILGAPPEGQQPPLRDSS